MKEKYYLNFVNNNNNKNDDNNNNNKVFISQIIKKYQNNKSINK